MRRLARVLYFWLYASGVFYIAFRVRRLHQTVLCYHSVMPQDSLSDDKMSDQATISSEALEKVISHIRKRVSFTCTIGKPNTVVLTFDDGISNNYDFATEFLDSLGVEAYYFIPLDSHERQELTWHDRVILWADYLPPGNIVLPFSISGEKPVEIDISDPLSRRELCRIIFSALEGDLERQKPLLELIERDWPDILSRMSPAIRNKRARVMTSEEVETLKRNGHRVGAHSSTHNILSKLQIDIMKNDFERCASKINVLFNTRVFCYPVGSENAVNDLVLQTCDEEGFEYAFLNTDRTPEAYKNQVHLALPRNNIPFDAPPWELDAILLGLDKRLKSLARNLTR